MSQVANSTQSNPAGDHRTRLCAQGIGKSFSGVNVLAAVNVELLGGEVHTIMGENGAGKSTLMKILAGVHQPDSGSLLFNGQPITLSSPQTALRAGISLIHQEPLNFPDLTVAENIFLGRSVPRTTIGSINWHEMNRRAARLIESLGVKLDPKRRMRGLSIADQQMVELAAALSQEAKVLLMDEPTAALTPREAQELFRIVRRLRDQGVAIVFISHRIPEVFEISDRITVLRDGDFIGTRKVTETTPDEIVQMMVGRPLSALYERGPAEIGAPLLEVSGLSSDDRFRDISLTVRAGEIVGMAGLVGAGRTEVAETIFGVRRRTSGSVRIAGKEVHIRTPRDAVRHGLAYVPEDRQQHGLLTPMSIASNTSLASLAGFARMGFVSQKQERSTAEQWRGTLKTRLRDVAQPVKELSGGNQQKVVLAKWLNTHPNVLIVDEPTRGIDVGAKAEVHHVIAQLAQQGHAILMISSDLPEVLAMSDRIVVMREGKIAVELSKADATQEKVMSYAAGTTESGVAKHAPTPEPSTLLNLFSNFREVGILIFILLAFAVISFLQPQFYSLDNLRKIALERSLNLVLIVAIGQLMVIASRNIDLSVGSILGLSAIIAGGMLTAHPELPLIAGAGVAIAAGAVLGLFNGILVALLRIPAIIATLGTMTAYRGLVYIWSGGRQVNKNELPASLGELSISGPFGVPWLIFIVLIVMILAMLFLRYTRSGREIFAIGSNPHAAAVRGIPVKRVLILIFVLTGALAGLSGFLFPSRLGTINAGSAGMSYELVAISAVVIGGASVNGGSGSVIGTFLGCVLLAIMSIALTMLRISEDWQVAIYGTAILLACISDGYLRKRLSGGAT